MWGVIKDILILLGAFLIIVALAYVHHILYDRVATPQEVGGVVKCIDGYEMIVFKSSAIYRLDENKQIPCAEQGDTSVQ